MMIHRYSHCVNGGVVTSVRRTDLANKSDLMRYVEYSPTHGNKLTELRLIDVGLAFVVLSVLPKFVSCGHADTSAHSTVPDHAALFSYTNRKSPLVSFLTST